MFKLFKKIIKSVVDFVKSIFSKEEKKQEVIKTKEEKLGELFDKSVRGNAITEKDVELITADTPAEAIYIVDHFTGSPMFPQEGRVIYYFFGQFCENETVDEKLQQAILDVVLKFGPKIIETKGICIGARFFCRDN